MLEFLNIVNNAIDANTCGGLLNIVVLLRKVIDILKILIPIGLILFGLIDLGKAVIAGKEDEMKKAQGLLLKRVIYAVVVFLVVQIVIFATGLVGEKSWQNCWNAAGGSGAEVGVEDVD